MTTTERSHRDRRPKAAATPRYEPASIAAAPESIARGYRVATAAPQGPVYIALDAGLQEDELAEQVALPRLDRLQTPSRIGPEPAALDRLAQLLTAAERPVLVAGYAGRDPEAFDQLVALAELLAIGVIDTGWRLSFPNRHPLNVTGSDAIADADCVLFVDVKDMGKPTQELDRTTRRIASRIAPGATILDLGFNEVGISAWSHDFAAGEPDTAMTPATSSRAPCRRAVLASSHIPSTKTRPAPARRSASAKASASGCRRGPPPESTRTPGAPGAGACARRGGAGTAAAGSQHDRLCAGRRPTTSAVPNVRHGTSTSSKPAARASASSSSTRRSGKSSR